MVVYLGFVSKLFAQEVSLLIDRSASMSADKTAVVGQVLNETRSTISGWGTFVLVSWNTHVQQVRAWQPSEQEFHENLLSQSMDNTLIGQSLNDVVHGQVNRCLRLIMVVDGKPGDAADFQKVVTELNERTTLVIAVLTAEIDYMHTVQWYQNVSHAANYDVIVFSTETFVDAVITTVTSPGCPSG